MPAGNVCLFYQGIALRKFHIAQLCEKKFCRGHESFTADCTWCINMKGNARFSSNTHTFPHSCTEIQKVPHDRVFIMRTMLQIAVSEA